MENYYEILEVKRNFTKEELKKAYITKVKEYPPEKNRNKFQRISNAYKILKSDKDRKNYDYQIYFEDFQLTLRKKKYIEAEKNLELAIDSTEGESSNCIDLIALSIFNHREEKIEKYKRRFKEILISDFNNFNDKTIEYLKIFLIENKIEEGIEFLKIGKKELEEIQKEEDYFYERMIEQLILLEKFKKDKCITEKLKETLYEKTKESILNKEYNIDSRIENIRRESLPKFIKDCSYIRENYSLIFYGTNFDVIINEIFGKIIGNIINN